jgi:hypothetical protein
VAEPVLWQNLDILDIRALEGAASALSTWTSARKEMPHSVLPGELIKTLLFDGEVEAIKDDQSELLDHLHTLIRNAVNIRSLIFPLMDANMPIAMSLVTAMPSAVQTLTNLECIWDFENVQRISLINDLKNLKHLHLTVIDYFCTSWGNSPWTLPVLQSLLWWTQPDEKLDYMDFLAHCSFPVLKKLDLLPLITMPYRTSPILAHTFSALLQSKPTIIALTIMAKPRVFEHLLPCISRITRHVSVIRPACALVEWLPSTVKDLELVWVTDDDMDGIYDTLDQLLETPISLDTLRLGQLRHPFSWTISREEFKANNKYVNRDKLWKKARECLRNGLHILDCDGKTVGDD